MIRFIIYKHFSKFTLEYSMLTTLLWIKIFINWHSNTKTNGLSVFLSVQMCVQTLNRRKFQKTKFRGFPINCGWRFPKQTNKREVSIFKINPSGFVKLCRKLETIRKPMHSQNWGGNKKKLPHHRIEKAERCEPVKQKDLSINYPHT